ncbi:MAG: ABC transporter ATP-binding protein [Clostridia bacterium]|nr:ABC transporter ATP-binding protein [Clostridia bacterium]
MNKNNLLVVNNLSVIIKDRFLVKNVSFSLPVGECYGIVGEDRSGKTSLLKVLSGSLPISQGQIFIENEDASANLSAFAKTSVCLDPPVFFKFQTVLNNLQYLSMLSGVHSKKEIIEVLKKFNLEKKLKTRVLFLSYFEKKLMALALAFLTKPKLMLLDEPFKNLPEAQIKQLKEHLTQLQLNGSSILISSQKIENLEEDCSKIIFMQDREIKQILTNNQCEKLVGEKEFAFVKVKYPHYTGTLLIKNFGLKVKILGNKVLFNGDEEKTSEIVRHLTVSKIETYSAGMITQKTEKIFASLTPFFKEEKNEENS